MSKRSRLESDLYDLVAGELDEPARRAVEQRLQADPSARALYAEIKAAHEALGVLRERPDPPVSAADALPRIHAAIASDAFAAKPKLYLEGEGTRFYRRVALAATVLLAVTAGLFVATRSAAPPPPAEGPVVTAPPTPAERGLERFVDAGSRGGIDAAEWLRMLREEGIEDPRDLRVIPMHNVVPVGLAEVEER